MHLKWLRVQVILDYLGRRLRNSIYNVQVLRYTVISMDEEDHRRLPLQSTKESIVMVCDCPNKLQGCTHSIRHRQFSKVISYTSIYTEHLNSDNRNPRRSESAPFHHRDTTSQLLINQLWHTFLP
jgi:hypothetical protein